MIKRIKKTLKNLTGHVGRRFRKRSPAIEKEQQQQKNQEAESKNAKVLMFGWEIPPFNSGGLGVACYELAQSLSGKNTAVTFVLPRHTDVKVPFMKVRCAKDPVSQKNKRVNITIKTIDSPLAPYLNQDSYDEILLNRKNNPGQNPIYGRDLIDEVMRYGEAAADIAMEEDFSIIHAHDWLSFPAGVKAKKVSGKPLIAHVHAIEYDRCDARAVNPAICAIERQGLRAANKVIAVSDYTRQRIHQFYGIALNKIEVVHNGINIAKHTTKKPTLKSLKSGGKKMVLFVGRLTYQKGVDYFVEAAFKALKINPKLIFMVVGSGDMTFQIIEQAAALGISDKVFFPGFLRGIELENIYRAADLYVMPSVSEPFGIVALEALSNKVPVIVSKQSGACEIINHALKVDFWDTDELANKIVAVINNPVLHRSLSHFGHIEAKNCTWELAADKCISIYKELATA